MPRTIVHNLTTRHDAASVERRGVLDDARLIFRTDPVERYAVGDGVVLTSSDGCTFIGEVDDVEPWDGRMYVRLT